MATKKLSFPGKPVAPSQEPAAFADLLKVEVTQQQEVIGVVRGEPLTRTAPVEVNDDDVVELQFDGGVVQYIRADDLAKESPKRRDAATGGDVIEVPAQFRRGGPSRGTFDWILKGLKVFRIDPAKELANLGEAELVKRFETKTEPKPGLYRVDKEGTLVDPLEPDDLTGSGPFLLFVHGTASSTNGSFGGIFIKRPEKGDAGSAAGPTEEWTKLRDVYGDRILALQHRTFSESPVENALYTIERLPKGARVHLVTHSRGGLVGELLGLKNISDASISVFEQKRAKDGKDPQAAKQAAQQLRRLADLLTQKELVVEKFVRVAAPARGTILASGRLDLYFTIILNAIGAIPILRNDPIYAVLKATALELIKRRTDPARLPGLEAMMPSSALVHFLNQGSTLKSDADLAVIAGDLQGDTFWTRLKALATDAFYLEEHDLVVNTAAMFGGMGRRKPAYGFYHRGGIVNHFNYFHNERTRARLHAWLTSKDPDPEFQKFDPEKPGIQIKPVVGRGAETKKPLLIVVPDVFGTRLPDEPLWMSSGEGRQLIPPYEPLIQHFSATHDVQALTWDWRDSIVTAAAELAAAIGEEVGEIQLVGHGAGGVVIHLLAQNHPERWGQVKRALLLGAPHDGMFAAVDWATGHSRLVQMFALADGLRSVPEIAAQIRRWKAIVELAPGEFLDPAVREANWDRVAEGSVPDAELLDRAWELRKQVLGKAPEQAFAVAGSAPETLVGYDRHARALTISPNGDGRVAHYQLHPGIETWLADAGHGDLPAAKAAFPAFAELLASGKTALLPRLVLPVSGAASERPELDEKPLFPQLDDLHAEALAIRTGSRQQEQYAIKVLVTHGDLRMAKYPVTVGHYLGDSINGVEETLDCQLGGRLTRRFQAGLYPGDAGTVEIVRVKNARPSGAIVVGLGQVGSATAETVRRGVTLAALRYALTVAEDPDDKPFPRSAAFSAVSIATRGGSVLDAAASIGAILRGALDANRLLRAQKLWNVVRIDEVELVELYEERAVAAFYAARGVADRLRLEAEEGERMDIQPRLRSTASGQYRNPPADTAMGWWQRLFVTVAEDEEQPLVPADLDEDDIDTAAATTAVPKKKKDRPMRFVVLGDRARVEAELQCRERNSTRHLIKSAITTTSFDPELSGALFELLVPNPIKAASAAAPNVIMVLDHDTAQYPWEVLSDPMVPDSGPYAVRTGMLRQFIAPKYRPAPRYAGGRSALVIGDTLIDPNPDNLPELIGAQEEAQGVARILGGAGYETRLHTRATATVVQTALFAKPYRILHLAGHGIYRPDRPAESGMVLGANVYLTPCQLRQLRTVPELVFLNCCFLGGIDRKANALAASVAEELINMGVKAVVAAGWAVDDSAAVTFASTFYQEMLERRSTFGEAVRQARLAVFRNHSATNTWAAYQCYGNPGFSLAEPADAAGDGGSDDFCSRREYLDYIRTLSARATELAASNDPAKRENLRKQLAAHVAQLPAEWRDDEMLTHIGLAWRDVGDYTNAVEALQAAYEDVGAFKTLEQLTNLLPRLAVEQHRHEKGAERDASIDRAEKRIELLEKLPENSERLAIIGSAAKRLAFVTKDPAKRKELLEKAAAKYSAAAALAWKRDDRPDPYPLLNAIAIRWLLGEPADELLEEAQSCEPIVQAWKDDDQYWKRGSWADYLLTAGLLNERLDVDTIAAAYRSALEKAGKKSEQLSVIEHIEFIAEMLKDHPNPARERLSAQAAELVDKLR
ncbi:MAG TPA: CHAT domain-containing protein [Thermoanaerobaculia bacterium]|nr:CHAT domain-containing protein [Thermoanaerobaculia bacterium]